MKQLQEALNKQLEALKKQIDAKGKQQSGSRSNSEFSEQFAKMVAQQEQIRRMMQKYAEELKQSTAGNAGKELDDIMQKMEQTEHDLVNKTITEQTIMRQQQIMTRLLEHEKAQMQREKDDRRQSTEAKEVQQLSTPDLEKYNQLKNKNIETLQTNPASFTDFYKNKVNEYFYNQWTVPPFRTYLQLSTPLLFPAVVQYFKTYQAKKHLVTRFSTWNFGKKTV